MKSCYKKLGGSYDKMHKKKSCYLDVCHGGERGGAPTTVPIKIFDHNSPNLNIWSQQSESKYVIQHNCTNQTCDLNL